MTSAVVQHLVWLQRPEDGRVSGPRRQVYADGTVDALGVARFLDEALEVADDQLTRRAMYFRVYPDAG